MKCGEVLRLRVFLAVILLVGLSGCDPKEASVIIKSSQLRAAYNGELVPVWLRCETEYCEPVLSAKQRVSEIRGINVNVMSNDSEFALFSQRAIEESGSRLSILLDGACRFECSSRIIGTNIVVNLITHELAMLGLDESFAANMRAERALVQIRLAEYPMICKGLEMSIRIAGDAGARILNAARKLENASDSVHPYVELDRLLMPEFYKLHIYMFVGDDDSAVDIGGVTSLNGDRTNVFWRIERGECVCVTNGMYQTPSSLPNGSVSGVYVNMPIETHAEKGK